MSNQNAIIIVDWLSIMFLYVVAILSTNKLFAGALKLKNSNCGINALTGIQFYTKVNNVSNMLDKNMFPGHIPKFYRVILNSRYIYTTN